MKLRVLLADDHTVVRAGFRALLEREGFEVVAEAADGREAARLALTLLPDVAVLDVSMPELNGIDAARGILRDVPRMGILLLTVHAEEHHVAEALRAHVRGYMLKTQAAPQLLQAIREVAAGGVFLSPAISGILVDSYVAGANAPPDPLTSREREVVQLVAEGKTTKEVAGTIGVTAKTVETYRARVMKKLGIHDTASLVRYAIRRGLV